MSNNYFLPDAHKRVQYCLYVLLLLATFSAFAQPTLVKDIATGSVPLTGQDSFKPESLVSINGIVYFSAFSPASGRELWRTDGSAVGTLLLKDIIFGAAGSEPANLAVVNNTLYFSASDGKSGRELWKSDGTAAGTVRLKDILPGSGSSAPTHLVGAGNTLYFVADDGVSGTELWKSDGTAAGTVRVKDVFAGSGSSSPHSLINLNGTLFFGANDGVSGKELWKSNGTATGTVRVRDINPGPSDGFVQDPYNSSEPKVLNGVLYFVGNDGVTGSDIWKSNGTEAGTVLAVDVEDAPRNLASANGTLYFSGFRSLGEDWWGDYELWKSDGTQTGTIMVKDIESGFSTYIERFESSDPSGMINVNGTVFFAASSGYEGRELWKTDGTEAGTVLVKDLLPETVWVRHPYRPWFGWEEPGNSNPTNFINVNGTLFCTSESGLWKSDGTEAGTVLLKPLSEITSMINVNGTVFLAGRDGENGSELWKSNGTATGTLLVKGKPASLPANAFPRDGLNISGTLYFAANSGLWKSNGTAATTTLVKQIGGGIWGLTNLNGKIYFTGNDGSHGAELWKSDGTSAGTVMVKDIYSGFEGSSPSSLTAMNGLLYFSATDSSGTELWKSDGTSAGTVMIKDIYPDGDYVTEYNEEYQEYMEVFKPYHSSPQWLTAINGTLYFTATTGETGHELWKSNGTAAGTMLVKDIYPGADSNSPFGSGSSYLTSLNGALYFISNDGSGTSLWKSTGTTASTVKVKQSAGGGILIMNNSLYFCSTRGELWKSNGTAAGTILVKAIEQGYNGNVLRAANGIIYFVMGHPTYGQELWRSDGTAAGTHLVKDLQPGNGGSDFSETAALGSDLYFAAGPAGNLGLWKTNGTSAGTLKVSSMQVYGLVTMNGELYFSGNDGLTGHELWKYNPSTCIPPATSTALQGSTVCLNSSRTVTVKAAQSGVRYQLYHAGVAVGTPKVGSGSDLVFTIGAASLFAGSYVFTVKAEGCQVVTLSQTATVTVTSPPAAPLANGVTINSGQRATLTASGAPVGATYRWYAAATGGTPLATTATYTTPALSTTTTYYVALYQLPCGESPRRAVTVTVNGGTVAKTFRVNAGGSAFSTIDARNFAADVYFSGGVVTTPTNLAIAGTADDFLYQTGRHGTAFTYNFPTGSGSYDVILHFAETYYGNTAPGGIGSRKFHVDAEGVRRLTDYDVFAKAGGALRARQETFRVNVGDGTLTVAFLKGSADNPAVKAIEILPAGSALAINSGGSNFRTAAGKAFSADVYYADGAPTTAVTGDVLNTTDDALYHTGRSGSAFSYGLPSGNGTFDVTLHFAETYYGKQVAGGVGSRKFNVYLEGVKQLSDYDIFAKAGGAMRAVKETRRVTVSDGVLNLYFAKGLAGNAYVSAVEVVPVAVAARESAEAEAGSAEWQVQLYPNPALDVLTVRLSFPVEAVQGTVVADAAGAALLVNAHRATAEGNLQMRVSALKSGLYLLHLDTDRGRRVVKFIKQ
jgi:ELWxxDGT repeat protein